MSKLCQLLALLIFVGFGCSLGHAQNSWFHVPVGGYGGNIPLPSCGAGNQGLGEYQTGNYKNWGTPNTSFYAVRALYHIRCGYVTELGSIVTNEILVAVCQDGTGEKCIPDTSNQSQKYTIKSKGAACMCVRG